MAGQEKPRLVISDGQGKALVAVARSELALEVRAPEVIRRAEELLLGREHHVASHDVLALAKISGRSAYDCEFIVTARHLNVKLVTSDRPLLAGFPEDAVALTAFGTDVADV